VVRREQNNFGGLGQGAEHQNLAGEAANVPLAYVYGGRYLAPDELLGRVVYRELGAGTAQSQFGTKVDQQFYGGLFGALELFSLNDGSYADFCLKKIVCGWHLGRIASRLF
jgi:hypothetical protein